VRTCPGTVDPRGLATTWSFEYGTTTRYGGHTPSRSASRAGPVSAVAGGLKPSTTYHYRLVATSAAGTSRGADQRLATPAAVRAGVATGPPSGISTTAATLGGTVNANGVPATWSVEYGSTAAYGSRTPSVVVAGTQQVSVRVTGLAPGTLYHYRLVVVNAAGTTTGADAQATTAAAPRTPGGDLVRCTIVGTTGNDVLHGTGHKDVICGLDGNDTIVGDGGSDVIYAGNGNDRVFGGLGNDVVFAGPGNDLAKGGTGRDTLDGGTGNDALYGDAGNDVVLGRAGSDVVAGGVNRDRLLGGPGDDVFIAADGFRDLVDGGAGDDRGSVDRGRDLARSISPA
jgi:Ca2+-binding RTX toxin-like protein